MGAAVLAGAMLPVAAQAEQTDQPYCTIVQKPITGANVVWTGVCPNGMVVDAWESAVQIGVSVYATPGSAEVSRRVRATRTPCRSRSAST
jgi:hypothetical protein